MIPSTELVQSSAHYVNEGLPKLTRRSQGTFPNVTSVTVNMNPAYAVPASTVQDLQEAL
jgi:hypothetical protein